MSVIKGIIFLTILLIVFSKKLKKGNLIVNLNIKEVHGDTHQVYPLTFGHVFERSKLYSNVEVKYKGSSLTTQFDIKKKYEDGSVRHGIISCIIPSISPNSETQLGLYVSDNSNNDGYYTVDQVLGSNVQSILKLDNLERSGHSGNLVANLRDSLNSTDSTEFYWLKGSVVSEIITTQRLTSSLNAVWELRVYPSINAVRISNTIENVESYHVGCVEYQLQIQYKERSPKIVFSKNKFLHSFLSRWRKVIWHHGEPSSEIELHYDSSYLIKTKHFLNYNISRKVTESTLQNLYNNWQNSNHSIMEFGKLEKNFPKAGWHSEIGPLPIWSTLLLYTWDYRMKEISLNYGELAGSVPIHWRENDENRNFNGHIISHEERPSLQLGCGEGGGIWAFDTGNYKCNPEDALPPTLDGSSNYKDCSGITPDRAHQGNIIYLPYIITGDYYYLEEPRANAWGFRSVAETSALIPNVGEKDFTLEREYFLRRIQVVIDFYINREKDSILGSWGDSSHPCNPGNCFNDISGCSTPWQEDYLLLMLFHINELGYDTTKIIEWFSWFIIDRFTHKNYNWFNGADYKIPLKFSNGENVKSWKDVKESMNSECIKTSISSSCSFCYAQSSLAVLGQLSNTFHTTKSKKGYEWLLKNINMPEEKYGTDPTFDIWPRKKSSTNLIGLYIGLGVFLTCIFFTVLICVIIIIIAIVVTFSIISSKKREGDVKLNDIT